MSLPGSFVNRLLRASLILPQGNFPGTNSNTLVLEKLRMSARLSAAGNFTNMCSLDIYGMRQVDMSAVSVIWAPASGSGVVPTAVNARALLILEANSGTGWLQVFEGQFQEAQANYEASPDVYLHLEAWTGAGAQWIAAPPSSFSGSVSVAGLAASLAKQMGFAFEDNGVTGVLNTPYLAGTLMDQFRQVAEAGRFDYYFDAKSTLIICPKNQPRKNQGAVVLSKTTGLIGYPTIQRYGLQVKALFQPSFQLGSPIEIRDSPVPGSNGLWYPYAAEHELDCIKPGGSWFSVMQLAPSSAAAAAAGQR